MATALKRAEPPAPAEIISIDPPSYVAAIYKPFEDRLALVKAEAPEVKYDIQTTAGMAMATEWRRRCREIRVEAEKERKARKAPILEVGKLLDSRYKELEAAILPLEDRFDADITAETQRKEAIRAEAARKELERIRLIQEHIADIRAMANFKPGTTSAQIDDLWHELDDDPLPEPIYQEFLGQAQNAKTETLAKLHEAYERVLAEEQERAEFERKKAALAKLVEEQKERDRQAKAQRDAEEAELRKQRDALAEQQRQAALKAKAAQDELDRQARELAKEQARQQAEIDRQRRELEAEQARVREAEEARLRAAEAKPDPVAEPEPLELSGDAPEVPRPTDEQLVDCIASHWGVSTDTAREWLTEFCGLPF